MAGHIKDTQAWVEHFVIALNLCPFAKNPFVQGRVRFVLESAIKPEALAETLVKESLYLHNLPPEALETTLIVHPHLFKGNFSAYLDFVALAESLIREIRLEGIIQIATFHPNYQFANTAPDDPENYTNRSPYPMLHLIREESVERALTHYKDPEQIPARNIQKMNVLGLEGIQKIWNKILSDE